MGEAECGDVALWKEGVNVGASALSLADMVPDGLVPGIASAWTMGTGDLDVSLVSLTISLALPLTGPLAEREPTGELPVELEPVLGAGGMSLRSEIIFCKLDSALSTFFSPAASRAASMAFFGGEMEAWRDRTVVVVGTPLSLEVAETAEVVEVDRC